MAAPWTEETVRQCLYLYLSLLPLNHRLVHELAAVYTEAIADIKRSVLRVIEQPVSINLKTKHLYAELVSGRNLVYLLAYLDQRNGHELS